MFEFSYKYAWHELLYLHKPLRFNSCRILLCSVGECDNTSVHYDLFGLFKICNWICNDVFRWSWSIGMSCVFVCVWMSLGFGSRIDCLFGTLLCGRLLQVKSLVESPVLVLSSIWLTDCVTCFIFSSVVICNVTFMCI